MYSYILAKMSCEGERNRMPFKIGSILEMPNRSNEKKCLKGKCSWQEGYGAFSYSHSHIANVYNYILNQEEHHKKRTFKEEYLELLKKFEVEFNEKYLFEWIE